MSNALDLSDLPHDQVAETVGGMVSLCLRSRRACVFIQRGDGAITVIDPHILLSISDEDMATALFNHQWTEEDVRHYLSSRR